MARMGVIQMDSWRKTVPRRMKVKYKREGSLDKSCIYYCILDVCAMWMNILMGNVNCYKEKSVIKIIIKYPGEITSNKYLYIFSNLIFIKILF